MAGHSHRSTVKNGHKPFKSRHSSKGAIKNKTKGKIEKESNSLKQKKGSSKLERKNLAKQLRENKITQTAEIRKVFDGVHGAEKIITVIPLTDDVTPEEIVNKLIDTANTEDASMIQGPSVTSVRINKYKSNLKFIIPDFNNFVSILDAAKVADYVVFGLSGTSEVDPEYGEQIIRALELQGIGHAMGVVTNLSVAQPKEKFQLDLKQSLQSYFKHFFPAEEKIYNLENSSDALVAIRTLCQRFPKSITWRDSRGWIVADEVNWENSNSQDAQEGYLTVEGTVRGIGFNANRLVHIPGHGDFQIERIERIQRNDLEAFNADENQETLDELAPNELSMEDWEDEEEYNYDDGEAVRYDNGYLPAEKVEKKKLNLPEGTSDYQAKWFLEDDIVEEDDEDLEDDEITSEPELVDDDEQMDVEDMQSEPADLQSEMFVELSPEEEERQLQLYREKEEEDYEFPDEVELNPTESGKERLKRFRGLKNLHNSIWDCDEYDPKAPSEWRRLLRISNFKATKNKILKDSIKEAQVTTGSRVKLYIKAPQFITSKISNWKEIPLIVYGLLEHEHKMAVVNFSIQPWEDYEKPIPSKDTIVVQYGPRRQVIKPLYSAASNNPNNAHKYERFLHKDSVGIATAIAPANFTNAPAIFFKQSSESPKKIELLGKGSFLNAEHQRVLAKRAILTGHPLKIHKNVVTIRYMFFNADDIQFFKAVPLFTKSGRSGFIKESLGTHGYFKANFDGKISSQDTVAMSLYKRVWPRPSIMWTQ